MLMREVKFNKKAFLAIMLCVILTAVSVAGLAGCANNDETKVSFKFVVVGKDGAEKTFDITTTKATVGEALLEKNLIAGDVSEYGLYVKTVDGTTLDYNEDGYYWAFYVNGEYAAKGVDSTPADEGVTYTFKAEKSDY
ncbi:MAG: DUF4430 domain-containing protein [Clostridia bacterium]|nr:DUF4430 domain-containing protein [Clostridia bacterium]